MKAFFITHTIWSFRKELKCVALAFLVVISLPIIAVFILTQTGIDIISDTLIGVDPETKTIVIKNPADGTVVAKISNEVVWPVQGVTTLSFGQSSSYQKFHTGIDIANSQGEVGDPIVAFMEGTVVYAGEIFWGYGKHIVIDHGDNITSVYAHLDRVFVYKSQRVKVGDTIGHMGSTGWSTGPHLHFEIRVYGIPVDPEVVLKGSS
jgi:murein DD-endopeptidase MepM/ murein hydrolase activator NlpD